MKKKIISMCLAVSMLLGLAGTAIAAPQIDVAQTAIIDDMTITGNTAVRVGNSFTFSTTVKVGDVFDSVVEPYKAYISDDMLNNCSVRAGDAFVITVTCSDTSLFTLPEDVINGTNMYGFSSTDNWHTEIFEETARTYADGVLTINIAVKSGVDYADLDAKLGDLTFKCENIQTKYTGNCTLLSQITGNTVIEYDDPVEGLTEIGTITYNFNDVNLTLTVRGGGGSPSTPVEPDEPDEPTTSTPSTSITPGLGDVTGDTTTTETEDGVVEETPYEEGKVTQTTQPDGTVTTVTQDNQGNSSEVTVNPDGSLTSEENRTDGTTVTTEGNEYGETTADVTVPEDKETTVIIPVVDTDKVTSVFVEDEEGNITKIDNFEIVDGGVSLVVDKNTSIIVGSAKETYIDVHDVDHWSELAVDYVSNRGIMNGVGDRLFHPEVSMTRGMLVTVLYRLEKEPLTDPTHTFEDIEDGAYYEDAVAWGYKHGIILGFSDEEYRPNLIVTREQMSAILHRYADYLSHELVDGSVNHYHDAHTITPYALEAMEWMVEVGIMNGVTSTMLHPQGDATRAQAAAMLQRFIELVFE